MSHYYKIAALMTAVLAASPAVGLAQTEETLPDNDRSNPISIKRTTDAEREILGRHREDTVRDVPAPHFVVKSANNNFILGIGGSLNLILGGDIGNNLYKQDGAAGSFVTNQIPVPSVPGHKGDFFFNPFNGYVDLQVTGFANTPNEISGYIKVGTNGIDSKIVLKRAYVTYRGFQAGLQQTLMQDGYACQPPTIDPEGPCGILSTTAYEIAYKSKSYGGFRFAAALDLPSYCSSNGYYRGKDYPKFTGKQVNTSLDQYVPDIPMWVEYTFSPNNRVRFSALIRNFHYRDLVSLKNRYTTGYGLMLSGNLSPVKPLIFYYQVAYGHGIGAYLQDLAGQEFSYVPDDKDPGKMKASPMLGATLGLTYNATSRLQFNAMFSESRIWDVEDYATAPDSGCNYKYALYGAVNCFYQLNSYLQFGLEYVWGRKVTWNMGGANDNRLQAQVAFTF